MPHPTDGDPDSPLGSSPGSTQLSFAFRRDRFPASGSGKSLSPLVARERRTGLAVRRALDELTPPSLVVVLHREWTRNVSVVRAVAWRERAGIDGVLHWFEIPWFLLQVSDAERLRHVIHALFEVVLAKTALLCDKHDDCREHPKLARACGNDMRARARWLPEIAT